MSGNVLNRTTSIYKASLCFKLFAQDSTTMMTVAVSFSSISKPSCAVVTWSRLTLLWFLLFPIACRAVNRNVDLANLSGGAGFTIVGGAAGDRSGASVSNAGDVNGDGIDDVVVASYLADPSIAGSVKSEAGIVYVIFGRKYTSGASSYSNINLASLNAAGSTLGFAIISGSNTDQAGYSVSGAVDVNSDGLDDVIVGGVLVDLVVAGVLRSDAGMTFVVFGRRYTTGVNAYTNIYLSVIAAGGSPLGFAVFGPTSGAQSGFSVSGAGDVNKDGIADLIIGSIVASPAGRPQAGTAHVIFGRNFSTGASSYLPIDLLTLATGSTLGFAIYGENAGDNLGWSVSDAGDVNGDNVDDVIVNSHGADPTVNGVLRPEAGLSYVVFGRSKALQGAASYTNIDLRNLFATGNGFVITGAEVADVSGTSVSKAGDVNGDGFDDVLVGAPGANPIRGGTTTHDAGIAYVIFGRAACTNIDLALFQIPGANTNLGFAILGVTLGDSVGNAVSNAGDVNGDGIDDVIVSGYGADAVIGTTVKVDAGVSYVIYGRKYTRGTASYTNIDLLEVVTGESQLGYAIKGAANSDQSGGAVSGAGDVNGDGMGDLLVGAFLSNAGGTDSGASYVVFSVIPTPTSQPSSQPSRQPSRQPTSQPSRQPSLQPNTQPTSRPSTQPSGQPTSQPVLPPTAQPSAQPRSHPTSQPTAQPSSRPTMRPSVQPTAQPSTQPSSQPSAAPSTQPVCRPSSQPSMQPSSQPSSQPTSQPTRVPSALPTSQPTTWPSSQPPQQPTAQPTTKPSLQPSSRPSAQPTCVPSSRPTCQPSVQPSVQPISRPSAVPTSQPSVQPSTCPSSQPTVRPSSCPSVVPSTQPSAQPSSVPSQQPTIQPSMQPTSSPSTQQTSRPSLQPTTTPTSIPTVQPSAQPTCVPSCQPSAQPTIQPSSTPSSQPSTQPSCQPNSQPSLVPTSQPSVQPTTTPSAQPTAQPIAQPSRQPTNTPSAQPSNRPSAHPTRRWSGEWVTVSSIEEAPQTIFDAHGELWACGVNGQCVVVDGSTGNTVLVHPISAWSDVYSVMEVSPPRLTIGGHTLINGRVTSDVATCTPILNELQCNAISYHDATLVAVAYVPYPKKIVNVGKVNVFPSVTVVDVVSNAAQTYLYTASNYKELALSQVQSPPYFAGGFVAGTTVRATAAPVNVIVVGMVRTEAGIMGGMALTPQNSNIMNSVDLVTDMALETTGPDSFVAGGLELDDGIGVHAYLIRANALFMTIQYCARYISLSDDGGRRLSGAATPYSVVRSVILVDTILFMAVDYTYNNTTSLTLLKTSSINGAIVKQVHVISTNSTSIHCTDMTIAESLLRIVCSTSTNVSIMLTVDQELSLTALPDGFMRSEQSIFQREMVPFTRSVLTITKTAATIATTSYDFTTSGAGPSRRPSEAPSLIPSSQPTSVPSTQPSSSPTSTPSVSPEPTSQPSSATPTNTHKPSPAPTPQSTVKPTSAPTPSPSLRPTCKPTPPPTVLPSAAPTLQPTTAPAAWPTRNPSLRPTRKPTVLLTTRPTIAATALPTIAESSEVDSSRGGLPSYLVGTCVGGGLGLLLVLYTVYRYVQYKEEEKAREVRKKDYYIQQALLVAQQHAEMEQYLQREALITAEKKEAKEQRRLARFHNSVNTGRSRQYGGGACATGPVRQAPVESGSDEESGTESDCVVLSSLHSSELSSVVCTSEHSSNELYNDVHSTNDYHDQSDMSESRSVYFSDQTQSVVRSDDDTDFVADSSGNGSDADVSGNDHVENYVKCH